MYLTEIDPDTGLVSFEKEKDGWLAIPSFYALYKHSKFGIKAFTAVALYCDYLSPIRHYQDDERHLKAIDSVYDRRKDILWNNDLVQEAIIDYKSLQFDSTIEEKRMLEEMKVKKLNEIRAEVDDDMKMSLLAQLKKINTNIDDFNKNNKGVDLHKNSPVVNGYALSRLEQKMLNHKSFYYEKDKSKIRRPTSTED